MKPGIRALGFAGALVVSCAAPGIAQDYVTDFTAAADMLGFNFAQDNGKDARTLETSRIGTLDVLQDAPTSPSILFQPPASVATARLPEWVGKDFVISATFGLEGRRFFRLRLNGF